MKFRRSLQFLGMFVAAVPLTASAFVTTFPAGTYGPLGTEVAGKEGWTISDPGPDGHASPLSFSNNLNGSVAAELGGAYDPPLATPPTSVFLSHDTAGEFQYTSFNLEFAIAGSSELYPTRDGFGFGMRDSSNGNLLSVVLVPDTGDAYRVAYTVGNGPIVYAQDGLGSPMYIHQNGLYSLSLNITPGGANPTFSATVTGTNAQTFTGIATGLGSSTVDRFGALWNVAASTTAGDNGIIFDNLSVVPESSTALLAGLASFGLLRRRRTA